MPSTFPPPTTLIGLLLLALMTSACEPSGAQRMAAPDSANAAPALKDAFEDAFLVGAALNPGPFTGADSAGAALVRKHFNTITPENVMKWEAIHPEPGRYDFEQADAYVAFGEENDMFTLGHTLVWHQQTPGWVFEKEDGTPVSRDTLIARMRSHIHTVVGRYKGRVGGWDVVNEALDEDGTLRETPWLEIIGEAYLPMAFRFAREADPDAELYYNDYLLEDSTKRAGAVRLIQRLQEEGAPITGIGTQAHHAVGSDAPSVESQATTIEAFAALGVDVMVTELDITVLPRPPWDADLSESEALSAEFNPYPEALPDSMQQALARRYRALFEVFLDHRDAITRVTFWGVTDGDSWLNDSPLAGRTNYPLLFDRQHEPKPAFQAVVEAAHEADQK